MNRWLTSLQLGALRNAVLCACLLAAGSTPGAEPGERSPVARTEAASVPLATGSESLRVAVPEPSPKAMDYYWSGNALWIVAQALSLAIPAMVLLSGLSTRMRTFAQGAGRPWLAMILIYFLLYSILVYALSFPLSYYSGYVRQHAFGLSNQTFSRWFGNSLKSLAVGLVSGSLVIWLPYLLIRRSPRRWWLYTGVLSLPLLLFVTLVEPLWISPLFNRFGPMKDQKLESEILNLARQAGIEGGRVFEVDKSVDTRAVNAYVTGFLGSKRIVLWDTLLAKLNAREVRVVMAHEMGHYVLNHVTQGILTGFLGILAVLFGTHHLARLALRRFRERLGFGDLSDVASLPLLLFCLGFLSLVSQPLGLALSRHWEREADRFALELTRDNHAAATAFVRLQTENLANPRPGKLFVMWRGSHPSLAERIEFANDYRPWQGSAPLRYSRLFRQP